MKIFFRKCPKFVSTPFFCISKSFGYFYQRKIIHNIGVCVQSWPIVDLSQVLILLCIEKDRLGVADVTPLVSTILMIVQIFLIIERFSSSMSWNVLQISQKSTGADCLKIAGMRWSSLSNWLRSKSPWKSASKTFNSFDESALLMAFKSNSSTFLNFFNVGCSNRSLLALMTAPRAWKYTDLKYSWAVSGW